MVVNIELKTDIKKKIVPNGICEDCGKEIYCIDKIINYIEQYSKRDDNQLLSVSDLIFDLKQEFNEKV